MIRIGIDQFGRPIFLRIEDLLKHVLICGTTGSGKSKLVEILLWHLMTRGYGWTLIDPKGHTAGDLLARITEERGRFSPFRLKKLVYLDPARGFYFDPFATTLTGRDYRRWLAVRIESFMLAMVRMDGATDYAEMPRKSRWTANVCWFCAVRRGQKPHLGLHRVFDVLDVGAPAWNRLFGTVEPFLPEPVLRDFQLIRGLSPRDRLHLTESTVNGFRRLFTNDDTMEIFRGPNKH